MILKSKQYVSPPDEKSSHGGYRGQTPKYFTLTLVCHAQGAEICLEEQNIFLHPSDAILPLMKIILPPTLKRESAPDEKSSGHATVISHLTRHKKICLNCKENSKRNNIVFEKDDSVVGFESFYFLDNGQTVIRFGFR